jgi:multidrug efflux pump subunit AcrA (membrane-fusion protein)
MKFFDQLAIAFLISIGVYYSVESNKPPVSIAQSSPQPQQFLNPVVTTSSPRLHKINLEISEPSDLKVKVGDAVSAAQVIADQDQERRRLTLKKEELKLAIARVESQKISPPQKSIDPDKPKEVPPLEQLPPFSTTEHEAAINKAELELKRVQNTLDLKQRQIDYLKALTGIDPAILEHESAQLTEIQTKLEVAQSELDLANGKLETAKNKRKQEEYQHSLDIARRVEEANQAQSFYQRQLAENQINHQRQLSTYEKELRDRDYQLTQLKLQSSSIDDKLAQLAVIRSPYSGQVKRIKFVGQNDNKLNVELSLIVGSSTRDRGSTSPSNSNPLTPTN